MQVGLPFEVELVIWDWNGTLFDDAWLCVEVMNAMLAARGLGPISANRYAAVFRFPVSAYYAALGFDFAVEPFERLGTEFIERYQARETECRLRAQAADVLASVARIGIEQTVLSASQQWRLEEQVRRHGVGRHFSAVLGLDHHFATSKVARGGEWLRDRVVDPRRVVLVGDTDHDVEVAHDLGVLCFLIPSGHQSLPRLAACGVPVMRSLADLTNAIAVGPAKG